MFWFDKLSPKDQSYKLLVKRECIIKGNHPLEGIIGEVLKFNRKKQIFKFKFRQWKKYKIIEIECKYVKLL